MSYTCTLERNKHDVSISAAWSTLRHAHTNIQRITSINSLSLSRSYAVLCLALCTFAFFRFLFGEVVVSIHFCLYWSGADLFFFEIANNTRKPYFALKFEIEWKMCSKEFNTWCLVICNEILVAFCAIFDIWILFFWL